MLASLLKPTVTRPLARALSTSRPASMPLYLCYCPDYPDNLDARLKVREAHLAEATKDKEAGASGESRIRARERSERARAMYPPVVHARAMPPTSGPSQHAVGPRPHLARRPPPRPANTPQSLAAPTSPTR